MQIIFCKNGAFIDKIVGDNEIGKKVSFGEKCFQLLVTVSQKGHFQRKRVMHRILIELGEERVVDKALQNQLRVHVCGQFFSEGGLPIGGSLEDLGKNLRSQVGTLYGTLAKGPRYLELAEGYIKTLAIDANDEICGYEFVHLGKFMDAVKKGVDANEALKQVTGTYGRFTKEAGAVKYIDPRKE